MAQPKAKIIIKLTACLGIFVLACLSIRIVFADSILKDQALEYRQQGYEAQKKGLLREALNYYQKAVSILPLYACVYNDLGIVYEMLGQTDSAEAAYLKAVSADPKYANAYTNLALLYERKGDFLSAAKAWVRRVYSGNPGDLWTKKAQERIFEIGRVIPEVKELYCPIAKSPGQEPNEATLLKSYFEDSNQIFQER